jgi:hypothetical protein
MTKSALCPAGKVLEQLYKHQIETAEDQRVILIMTANEMHYFSNLFDKVLYMFRTCPLSIISRRPQN